MPNRNPREPFDEDTRAAYEARNALLQFDAVRRLIRERITGFRISAADLRELQRIAVQDLCADAGEYRSFPVVIQHSLHRPPRHEDVPKLVEAMCRYAQTAYENPLHIPAYLMWRINWIHPFEDGNGRTSRAVAYFALCVNVGFEPPGATTVPELIVNNKAPYYAALEAADEAWAGGRLDVSAMESLIAEHLKTQLQSGLPGPGGL